MATPTSKLSIYSDGSIKVAAPSPAQLVQYYRQPHDIEIQNYNAGYRTYLGDGVRTGPVRDSVVNTGKGMPEVYRLLPDHQVPLECRWIKLWRNLNPMLSDERFGTLLGNGLAWTNRTGWPGRYNCLTGADAGAQDPAFDAARICGGAIFKGKEQDGYLYIESLLTSQATPTAADILEKPWLWYWGTTVLPTGQVNYITRLGTDGKHHPVRVPLLTRLPVRLSLSWLDRLPMGFIPPTPMWLP